MSVPTPQELQKDFQDFVHQKYGDSVNVITHFQKVEPQKTDEASALRRNRFNFDFQMRPKEVKSYLDRFVIKQDEAKKALSIAVCDHYNYVRECLKNPELKKSPYAKQNVLLLGPTGVGKTYLVSLIADMLGVPFVKADATTFTEAGYVGGNVDDMVKDLVHKAGGDVELAQFGIIYLDEADKLASPPNLMGRDVSGRGVQFGLLKLMEETEVDLRTPGDMASQLKAFAEFQQKGKVDRQIINTRHILFIVSGAFNGVKDLVRKRIGATKIGLSSQERKERPQEGDYLRLVETSDLVNFGFEPEFVGRLPVRVSCENLEAKDLENILQKSEGSILKQYERAFLHYGIEIHFIPSGIAKIAELAAKEKTGARSLMTVCEKTLRDFKYELPGAGIPEFVVDEELVTNPSQILAKLLLGAKKTDWENIFKVGRARVEKFKKAFAELYGIDILFPREVEEELIKRAFEVKKRPEIFCEQLLEKHHEALELIRGHRGSAERKFIFTKEGLDNPTQMLEDWVKETFQ